MASLWDAPKFTQDCYMRQLEKLDEGLAHDTETPRETSQTNCSGSSSALVWRHKRRIINRHRFDSEIQKKGRR